MYIEVIGNTKYRVYMSKKKKLINKSNTCVHGIDACKIKRVYNFKLKLKQER